MTILACVDGSRYITSVCDYAARAALRLGTGVDVLHAIDRHATDGNAVDHSGHMPPGMVDSVLEESVRLNEGRNRLAQRAARLVLDQAVGQIRQAGVKKVQEHLVFGGLVDSLRSHEQHARLIVLGKRGASEGQASSHIGSNLERVVRASHRPVLIVPPVSRPLRRFVVAYDGEPSTARIIDTLTEESLLTEAECHLVMVGDDTGDRQRQLATAAARLQEAGYAVTPLLKPGDADEVILATVRKIDADLLVMGAYGHSRVRTLIIGSTTTALLRASTLPLLVIR